MATWWFDLRDAARGLRRDWMYAATVTLTLALTIGATTAIFSIVDGVLLKPLAFRESRRLVGLAEIWRELADRIPSMPMNERHFEYWQQHAKSFESLAQYRPWTTANLTGAGEPGELVVIHASGSLFDVLGVPAAIGRTLTTDDERNRAEVVMLTDT